MVLCGPRRIEKLGHPGLIVGGFPDIRFEVQQFQIDAPCSLLLISDGLYEVAAADGAVMGFDQFIDLLRSNGAGPAIDLDGILQQIRRVAVGTGFSDDVSILRLDFADDLRKQSAAPRTPYTVLAAIDLGLHAPHRAGAESFQSLKHAAFMLSSFRTR